MNLTTNSKQIMQFFAKNTYLNNVNHTKRTTTILSDLYKDILEAYHYLHTIKEKQKEHYLILTTKQIVHSSQITKPKNFHINSFPELVRSHIHTFTQSEITFEFSIFERNIKIFFILDEPLNKIKIHTYNTYTDAIIMWLYIVNKHSSKNCVKTLNVYFYFTSLQKTFPESNTNSILDEINVNTAFTSTCPKDSEIVVFRKEEWFKVFIHESFHTFGLDFSNMNNTNIHNYILTIFKVHSKVNLYESYTEFWAETINALFCSFYTIKNKRNMNEFLSYSELFMNLERMYSFIQLVKILDFLELSYTDLYKQSQEKTREKYKEKTSVLAYYIIKTVLMNNYQDFLFWCHTHNTGSILQFKKTLTNQKNLCTFIHQHYKTTSMLHNIEDTQIFLDNLYNNKNNNNNKKDKKDFIFNNLRMSICELG